MAHQKQHQRDAIVFVVFCVEHADQSKQHSIKLYSGKTDYCGVHQLSDEYVPTDCFQLSVPTAPGCN